MQLEFGAFAIVEGQVGACKFHKGFLQPRSFVQNKPLKLYKSRRHKHATAGRVELQDHTSHAGILYYVTAGHGLRVLANEGRQATAEEAGIMEGMVQGHAWNQALHSISQRLLSGEVHSNAYQGEHSSH